MSDLSDYVENCDYIRKEFNLLDETSMYAIVNRITYAYKELKDKALLVVELSKQQAEQPLNQEKKRGRPRKDRDSN